MRLLIGTSGTASATVTDAAGDPVTTADVTLSILDDEGGTISGIADVALTGGVLGVYTGTIPPLDGIEEGVFYRLRLVAEWDGGDGRATVQRRVVGAHLKG